MAAYSNAQKLAAVLAEWSRPAIAQIATSKITTIPVFQSIEGGIRKSGLVGMNYKLSTDILPFMANSVNNLVEPMLEIWLGKLPDESIPSLAHGIVTAAMEQPKFSVLDGLVEFEQDDMIELKDLLDKNLPLCESVEKYSIIH